MGRKSGLAAPAAKTLVWGRNMDYCITIRVPSGAGFGNEPGKTSFLAVPDGANDFAQSQIIGSADWVRAVLEQVGIGRKDATGTIRRDLLVFIHGYDNEPPVVLQRQRKLKADLKKAGYLGGIVSFDWPSGDVALAYLPDREKAKQTVCANASGCRLRYKHSFTGPFNGSLRRSRGI
jgi:hypothetical protein